MKAVAYRASLAASLASIVSLLAGCDGRAALLAIPASSAEFKTPNANAGVKIWATAEQTSKLFGLSLDGKRVLTVISTKNQPVKGGSPLTLKVDGKNLFVTDVSGGKAGVIQEYEDGRFVRGYSPSCPAANCSKFTGSIGDAVVDKSYVFAIMKQVRYQVGSKTVSGSGYEYWPKGNPSAAPVTVLLSSDCSEVCFYDAGDEDSSGNLWLRDYGGNGYGVAEITNPTSNPSMSQGLPLETFTINSGDIGGFFISNDGTVLNVGDSSHKIYQYALPVSDASTPFNTLTPCVEGCDPHGFGFNSTGARAVAGDGTAGKQSKGWLDIGQVSTNHWRKVTNPKFTVPLSSAVYLRGD
jgi:hypothetical protein